MVLECSTTLRVVGCIRQLAVSGPLSPAIDIHPTGGHVAGERVGVRGPHRSLWPPHLGPLPHSGVFTESDTDCGGEGAETTEHLPIGEGTQRRATMPLTVVTTAHIPYR